MKRYQMAKKMNGEAEQTEQLLLRPRVTLLNRLTEAAENAKRFVTRNQVALEILERYLPFWEELERQHEANVEAQYARLTVFTPQSDPQAPLARAVKDVDGALEAERGDVTDVRPATDEEVERAHGHEKKGSARKRRR